jgi:dihydrofolate reductase
VVTDVDLDVAGDTWAPQLGPGWTPARREPATGWSRSSTGLGYAVTTFTRDPAGGLPAGSVHAAAAG